MTIWSPDLPADGSPRYRALADRLAADIATGRLAVGTRLPTHRDLAHRLGVTVGTVSRAYAEAERRGLIAGEVGRGTFVRGTAQPAAELFPPAAGSGAVIDMAVNAAALGPERQILALALGEVARGIEEDDILGYQPHAGHDRHRQAGAAWLRARGCPADAAEVMVTHGGQNTMALLLQAMTRPGDALMVERLTYPGLKAVAALLDLRLIALDLDEAGVMPESLDQQAEASGARLAYLMPTVHNPTTATLPEARRRDLARIARARRLLLIEDDLYGFLDPASPLPMASEAPEVVAYINGLSKSITPGLRIGFLKAPPEVMARVSAVMRATSWMAGPLNAEVARILIESGEAERIARMRRAEAAERQQLARRVLGNAAFDSREASFHLWLHLPEPWRREEFAEAALRRGVRVTRADAFAVGRAPLEHAVRICLCSSPSRQQVEAGLGILADLLHDAPDRLPPVV